MSQDSDITRRDVIATGALGLGGGMLPNGDWEFGTQDVNPPESIPKGQVRYKRTLVDIQVNNDVDVPTSGTVPRMTGDRMPPTKQSADQLVVSQSPLEFSSN